MLALSCPGDKHRCLIEGRAGYCKFTGVELSSTKLEEEPGCRKPGAPVYEQSGDGEVASSVRRWRFLAEHLRRGKREPLPLRRRHSVKDHIASQGVAELEAVLP